MASLTVDTATNTLYATEGTELLIVNPANGSMSQGRAFRNSEGYLDDVMYDFAFDSANSTLYGVSGGGVFYSITTDGFCTIIGSGMPTDGTAIRGLG